MFEAPSEFPLHLGGERGNSHHTLQHSTPVAALQCLSNQGAPFQITVNALANPHQPPVHCKDWEGKHGNNNLLFWWVVSCCADSIPAGAGPVNI